MESGLQINLHKSKLYGVGVEQDDIAQLVACIGCGAESIPFLILGLLLASLCIGSWRGTQFLPGSVKNFRVGNQRCYLLKAD